MPAKNTVLPLILLTGGVVIGFLVYQAIPLPAASPMTASVTPSPAAPSPATSPNPTTPLKADWKIYKNEQYGFEFSYPEAYKVLTDEENLYGWPKAVLLLYKGGQSYDLTIEVWGSDPANYDLTLKTKDGKFIALKNLNNDPEVAEIITTFKLAD